MSPMDKVALDLYAISQGTQKLFGDDSETDGKSEEETETTTLEISTGNIFKIFITNLLFTK